ncbi:hypothetical protein PF005_g471 [Phytophthora fragariae]|uniref:Uncharacterized protein n=1 Tax=Phytophthora fragariae TaxID=53985 RepID=A0A6A3FNB9_9STRA|nr:hypothetical protein PF003_g13218 [Phytophthora fragariae]KAE8946712.1 hypothetical protein PF009_g3658 [Phytophthora fragariae]KAE9027676.1 hypothetical protein PF011_g1929 [Phytophthora fragariae]KAE9102238.1 hypothetical protein PF010_g14180 [Phytophthora fragariae]KAE9140894.1 hypothetical protein PF007_g478 [Phytophthora fragariae]
MIVDALVIEGKSAMFLVGKEWMLKKGVRIDFVSCEMKWYQGGLKKVVPFQCSKYTGGRTARARLVRRARVRTGTRHNVKLAVSAPDGTAGLFLPDRRVEPHLFMAPTLTEAR